jgi:hypothetical protein
MYTPVLLSIYSRRRIYNRLLYDNNGDAVLLNVFTSPLLLGTDTSDRVYSTSKQSLKV